MQAGKVNFVCDAGFGSSGKGKMCAYLAREEAADLSIVSNGSQAGHSGEGRDGVMAVTQQIPMATAIGEAPGLIGPGAMIDLKVLKAEIERFKVQPWDYAHGFGASDQDPRSLGIHPHAAIINAKHKQTEAQVTKRISSTMKGNGACLADKVLRHPELKIAADIEWLKPYIVDTTEILHRNLWDGKRVIGEMSQGFGLDLDHGFYPYVTGRHCTPVAEAARIGISHKEIGNVYLCARTYDIRVGNVEGGFSGPVYPDQGELTWEEVTRRAGSPEPLIERTTVTKRVRRVFEFSVQGFRRALIHTAPTHIFMNFINYLDHRLTGLTGLDEIPEGAEEKLNDFVRNKLMKAHPDVYVSYLGTGPGHADMVDATVRTKGA